MGPDPEDVAAGLARRAKGLASTLGHVPRAMALVKDASPGGMAALGVLALVTACLPVALVYVSKLIVDAVVAGANAEAELAKAWQQRVAWLVALELGLAAVLVILQRVMGVCRQWTGEKLTLHVNVLILQKALTLDLAHFEDSTFYDRMTRARREAGTRPLQMMTQTFALGQHAVAVLGYLSALVLLGWWVVPVLVLAGMPGFLSEVRFSAETFRMRSRQSPDARRLSYLEYVLGTDTYVKEVKVFGLGPSFLQRYQTLARALFTEFVGLLVRRTTVSVILGLLGTLAFYGCYVVVALQAASGEISLGDLTLYGLAFRQGQASFQALLGALGSMYESNLYLSNLFEYLATPSGCARISMVEPTPTPADKKVPHLCFDGVSFQYPGTDRMVLQDINITVARGSSIALVGSNGAGKTTLIKLLAGLYEPTRGRVLLQGRPVRSMAPEELRRNLTVIFQDFNRYQMSVKENVGVGAVEFMQDEPRIQRALLHAGAREWLDQLPEGWETVLGRWFQHGTELSGGQWQAVALARAFMREEAETLILDEPTASLDAEAEYRVFQRFRELTVGRTALIISHRFPTVRLADRIYVMDNGRVVEQGTHAELLDANGTYARMFSLQADGYK